mgnify:CR=1 FL=1
MGFKFIADPGHAWLKVEKSIAELVGYAPTSYDYEDNKHYYFEEDCSAFNFIKKYEAHNQCRAEFTDTEYVENFKQTVRRCA